MTMPDAIAILRAPAMPEASPQAAAPVAAGAATGAATGGDGFAQTLAGAMRPDGATDGATAAGAAMTPVTTGAAEEAAQTDAPGVTLDDLGKVATLLPGVAPTIAVLEEAAALLPGAGTETPAPDAPVPNGTALTPTVAVALKTALVGATAEGETETPGEDAAATDGEVSAETDPVAALAAATAPAAPPPVTAPDGEGAAALGQAVSAAPAGGAMQPMMQAQVRPATPASVLAAEAGDGATEAAGEVPEVASATGSVAAAEAAQRREMAGLTPTLAQAAERAMAVPGAEAAVEAAVEAVASAPAGGAAPSQTLPQGAAPPAMAGGMPSFGPAGPILTDRPGWETALADRISAELSGDGQQIDLELAPDHLGRLKIRLDMSDGQALVRFVTETPEAARLIQQNEHRLSEAMTRAGLSLGGQETASRDPQGDQRPARGDGLGGRFLERATDGVVAAATRPAQRGLVNLIA
jgi:flagellar hook-length control protein FliK